MKKKAAVIDMGTNTFHLLMIAFDNDGFEVIYQEKVPVKIGQGGINQNIILPEAEKRGLHTLEHFHNLIIGEGISQIFAFATSAVRNADNGFSFIRKIKQQTGIDAQIIDGEREAELIYKGIRLSACLNAENALMMDIGGGSVEFIIGNTHEIHWKGSFEIGGQRLLDLFHYHDPILPEEVEKLSIYLSEKLAPLIEAIKTHAPKQLIGASGTFDTLTDMYLASEGKKKDRKTIRHILPVSSFEIIASDLLLLDKAKRLKIPGMIPMRVDMIVVASCLIRFITQFIPTNQLICSTYSLKEGAVSEAMIKTGEIKSTSLSPTQ
ncbi:exopolyphosphatase [Cyclobacterium sp. 1_MG-2023]|uniref:Ppx/GppA phosphatase family protein n=1 Tax=Cyclobacterium sp. 1_MG-2023 TaxID=3062681 RepID=UPI0026E1D037|nr:exopolyphosphatase [Cyclobacterium sp. 1_MG-2023]MDO6439595.1 exopolyphosphatase [Cyclobacterium sp. 1_MG-2023]